MPDPRPTILKVSSQRQLTLTKALLAHLGNPTHFECVLRGNRSLLLEPVQKLTLDEAARLYEPHGIGRDVLMEALLILERRRRREAAERAAADGGTGDRS